MGLLGKYVAYRWVSSGNSQNGGGGGGGLGIVALIFGVLFGLAFLVNFLVMGITDIVFTYIRPIFLIAPTTITALVALPVVAGLALIPKYTPEAANEILAPDGSSIWFYTKSLLLIGFINFYVYGLLNDYSGQLQASDMTGASALWIIWTFAILYWTYKIFHFPYRLHRLLQHAQHGYLYSVIAMLPLMTTIIAVVLRIPVFYEEPSILFVAVVNSSFVLALLFMKFRAEPHIKTAALSENLNRTKPPFYQSDPSSE